MSEIAVFLLARIAEDEAAAESADCGPRWAMAHDLPNTQAGIRAHIIKYSPARVLVECEAKRRIVEIAMRDESDAAGERRRILRVLATVYADHPDYQQAWRP